MHSSSELIICRNPTLYGFRELCCVALDREELNDKTAIRIAKQKQNIADGSAQDPIGRVGLLINPKSEMRLSVCASKLGIGLPRYIAKVMSQLGPKQRAFCEQVVCSISPSVDDIQEKLNLKSPEEVRSVISNLRKQLQAVNINPQEV